MSGPNACTLSDGKHYISTSNTCVGLHKDPNVVNVVVNGVKTPFYFQKAQFGHSCVYKITTDKVGGNDFVRHDKNWINVAGNHQEWIVNPVPGHKDTYTVALSEDPTCGWIDPVNDYERQLQLVHPLNPNNPHQQFRISDH